MKIHVSMLPTRTSSWGVQPQVRADCYRNAPLCSTPAKFGGREGYQIVSEAGGEIAVSSSSAVGTEFTVVLPTGKLAPESTDGPAGRTA